MSRIRHPVFAAVTVILGSIASNLAAQSVDFYKDKTVRMIVGQASGGDYDLWARLISRHMNRYIPGDPAFVTQNMPGGGHIIATNYLYNVAPQDGTVLGMISRNIPNEAVMKNPNVKFDPMKIHWIGSPEITNRACFGAGDASVKVAKDLFERELIVAGTGAGTAISTSPTLLKNLLGMKFRLVEGYAGPPAAMLALERGEVQGICQTVTAIETLRPGWIESGKLRVLFTMEEAPIPGIEAPTIFEFANTDRQRQILAFYASSLELGRPVLAPPGVPADRVNLLRRAFDATMIDSALIDEAAKLKVKITPRTGEKLHEFIRALVDTPEEIIKEASIMTQ